MAEFSRRAVLATLGATAAGGCLSRFGDDPDDGTPSGTPTGAGITQGADEPDPDHSVYLSNESDSERTVRVTVTRTATEEVVFDKTRTVAPGSEREVYNLERAGPEGVESFLVCGHLPDAEGTESTGTSNSPSQGCETIESSRCYGDAHVSVLESGELRVIYSIC